VVGSEGPRCAKVGHVPPAPLAALAPERTVYVSGLSKSVSTGLRVGFSSAPTTLLPSIERAIRATTWNTPGVMTTIACRWLDDGTVARLEAQKRADAEARQSIAPDVLADMTVVGHPSSYFLWLPLPAEVRADRVAGALITEKVSVATA
jgi:DNA-binding transcriptional MocR family regulator